MIRLLEVEVRRDLSRRLVRVLVGLALGTCGLVSLAVYATSEPLSADQLACLEAGVTRPAPAFPHGSPVALLVPTPSCGVGDDDPRLLVHLWSGDAGGGLLAPAAFFLPVAAFVAGASMVGAEWKAGTLPLLLTWEPRRLRVLAAKLVASAGLAFVISGLFVAAFTAAFLPTVLLKGSTIGADTAWFGSLVATGLRISALASLTSILGGAVAMLGRGTSAAVGLALGYVMVFENVVRATAPELRRWLLSESAVVFVTWGRLDPGIERGPLAATATLAAYGALAATLAAVVFWRRDVAAAV